ncbi:hypothetical protein ACLB2K_076674 [Fragaria x ananassa]
MLLCAELSPYIETRFEVKPQDPNREGRWAQNGQYLNGLGRAVTVGIRAVTPLLRRFLSVSCRQATFSLFIFINFLSLFANPTSFSIPYFSSATKNILNEGDAIIKSGNFEFNPQNDNYRVARCTYSKPFQLWDSTTPARSLSNFTTNFTFMIDTGGDDFFADGFTFFIAPFGYPIPPNSAAGFGLFNSTNQLEKSQNRVVHIEFDAWSDTWDPTGSHVGVNINSISSVVTATWDFNGKRPKKLIYAQVTYNASNYMLTVFWKNNEATSSLDAHLFGPITTLQWDVRYKIALGLASALHYLHEDPEQCILHRDIKSANVLLDNDFNTKLGDFGIAKLLNPPLRTRTTGVAGTFGYMALEYAFQGRASKESDMFSFGVVALEISCGRQTYRDGEYHVPLSEWVWQSYLAGSLLDVADERLDMKFDPSEIKCLLIVGLWCTHPSNKERPKAG